MKRQSFEPFERERDRDRQTEREYPGGKQYTAVIISCFFKYHNIVFLLIIKDKKGVSVNN
jgi:hypothetical protein